MNKLEFSDFEFVYDFERTSISLIKEKLVEYLRKKGILSQKEKIEKISINIFEETGYEEEPGYYDEGFLATEYVPFQYNIYKITLRTNTKRTIKIEIDGANYDIVFLEVKENKQKVK